MIWSLIGSIGGKVLDIFDNKDEANRVKLENQRLGHTITAVFDPNTITETGFISCFVEPQKAVGF
jgi:hypothetical protein